MTEIDEFIDFHKRASEDLKKRAEEFDAKSYCSRISLEEAEMHLLEARWLEELIELRKMVKSTAFKDGERKGRADAIDDVERELLANGFIFTEHALEVWHNIAEQLKEQKKND